MGKAGAFNIMRREEIESVADWLLTEAKRRNANGADLQYCEEEGNALSLKDGEIEDCTSGASAALGVRVILSGGRQGTACCDRLDKDSVSSLLDWAIANAQKAEPEEYVTLYKGDNLVADADILKEDAEISKITAKERMNNCLRLTETAKIADKKIVSVRSAAWQDGHGQNFYASTEGLSGWESGSSAGCGLYLLATDGTSTEIGGYGTDARQLSEINIDQIAHRAIKDALASLGGKPITTGNYTVVIEPEATVPIIELIGNLFCATDIQKNRSMMKDKLGQTVAASCFSLTDDARIPWRPATSCWDAEGAPTQQTALIEKGVASHFLYNLQSAAKDGVKTTGNCVRGLSSLPDVSCSNLVLQGGKETSAQIVSGIKYGVYLTEFMGLHTIDPISGDFSIGAKGRLIEDGEFSRAVSGITIMSNLLDFLKNITAVGSDIKFYGSVATAAIAVENITIAGE